MNVPQFFCDFHFKNIYYGKYNKCLSQQQCLVRLVASKYRKNKIPLIDNLDDFIQEGALVYCLAKKKFNGKGDFKGFFLQQFKFHLLNLSNPQRKNSLGRLKKVDNIIFEKINYLNRSFYKKN